MSISVSSSPDALSSLQSLLQSVANSAGNVAGVGPVGDFLAGAVNSLGSAVNSGSAGTSGTQPFGLAPPQFQSGTLAALIALQGQGTTGASGSSGPQSLFSQLDSDGDGSISKSDFEAALSKSGVDTKSADALFAKLDQNGDGSVSQSELSSAMHRHGHHHHMDADGDGDGSGGVQGGLASLLNSAGANGAKTQTATNADGSSTTTITYADGSTVTMTTPAAPTTGGSSGSTGSTGQGSGGSANLIEQLIKMQSQLVSQQGATVSAIV